MPRGTVPPKGTVPRAPRLNQPTSSRTPLLVAAGVAAILALCGAMAWVLLGSSLFDARAVQVLGASTLPADQVSAAAAVPLGTPMVRLDTDAIAARVGALRRVATVQVSRTLTGTVRIEITERAPIAVLCAADGIHLVDVTGTDYATVPPPPPPLPQLGVAHVAPGDPAAMAAIAVLTGLPPALRNQVVAVGADSPADVVLQLPDHRQVRWGGVEQGDRKAAVLGPLLTRDGSVYDVSSPDLPTVS